MLLALFFHSNIELVLEEKDSMKRMIEFINKARDNNDINNDLVEFVLNFVRTSFEVVLH